MSVDELDRMLDLDRRAQLLVDSLSEEEAAVLLRTITHASSEYAATLDAFANGILVALPRPLRGRAARILTGRA